jgi:hypothetical protein
MPGYYTATTPAELRLPRKLAPYRVRCEKDGFIPAQATVSYGMNPVVWGNFLGLFLVGFVVDASTGAIKDLAPDHVHLELGLNPDAGLPPEPR